uniref:Uncharacterized protein n=1 Tax=Romanomermis culicivorax TaxID=13658 RepID=A0A915KBA9_ROMCU
MEWIAFPFLARKPKVPRDLLPVSSNPLKNRTRKVFLSVLKIVVPKLLYISPIPTYENFKDQTLTCYEISLLRKDVTLNPNFNYVQKTMFYIKIATQLFGNFLEFIPTLYNS